MNKLSHREHARLARELIDHCGGLEEAAGACRVVGASQLAAPSPAKKASNILR